MGWSLNEARSLAVKAARGASLSWGLAEEAGFSVYWLQRSGLPGALALSDYLSAYDEVSVPNSPDLCPLTTGAALSDGIMDVEMSRLRVRYPVLMIPFLAVAAPSAVTVRIGDVDVNVNKYGAHTTYPPSAFMIDLAEVTTRLVDNIPGDPLVVSRVPSSEADAMAALAKFAQRTYAPATEASRLAGAGAGLNDND